MFRTEFAQGLIRTSNNPTLEHLSFCSGMLLDIPDDHAAGVFDDDVKKEIDRHDCMLNSHQDESATD
jgi:hypothetical protein